MIQKGVFEIHTQKMANLKAKCPVKLKGQQLFWFENVSFQNYQRSSKSLSLDGRRQLAK